MKITGEALCPTCNKEHPVSIDIDKLEIKTPQTSTLSNASTQTIQLEKPELKEVEKIIEKILPSADQPYYECKNCDKLHPNPNYRVKPNQKCNNCGSLNRPKAKGCKNCGNTEFEEISEDGLKELGVPEPELNEHEHQPTE